ncbi:hypothetical protein [Undibacterium sp. Di24W]|uniref:hypothetical protein n=1 Tax=Undibacterium sp. Di24W TaxID=3413033 RepID=UPI003BF2C8F6
MPIYIAIPLQNNAEKLSESVHRNFPGDSNKHNLQSNKGWLLEFDGTTIDLSNKLEVTGQAKGIASPVGSCIIIPVTGYYGRGSNDMWEWLKIKMED